MAQGPFAGMFVLKNVIRPRLIELSRLSPFVSLSFSSVSFSSLFVSLPLLALRVVLKRERDYTACNPLIKIRLTSIATTSK